MTAVTDDSVGGDTNGDGAATGAQEEWLGIQVEGSLKLDHTIVDYTFGAIRGEEPKTFVVRDSTLRHQFSFGISLAALTSSVVPEISRNTISDTAGPAMVLNSSNLAPAKLAGNDGSANGGGLRLAGAIGTSGTLSMGTLVPEIGVGWDGPPTLVIPNGVTPDDSGRPGGQGKPPLLP